MPTASCAEGNGVPALQIAVSAGAAASGADWPVVEQFALASEELGADFCWSAEAWGQDAVAPLAYLAARTRRIRLGTGIMQISARVPAMTAMTAITLATLSSGRFVLGLGVSGPQVVEGLHGADFGHPLGRLREYLDILDLAFAGQPLRYQGRYYQLPRPGGQGKVLRLAQAPERKIPVYLATLGPRGLELTGARADGWLGNCFIPEASDAVTGPLRQGAEGAGRSLADLDLQAGGPVAFGTELGELTGGVKRGIAFRLGAMGSRELNFYNQAYQRAGFATEARRIQELWLDGRRDEAIAAVTDDMALLSSFVGTEEMVASRVEAFSRAGITTLRAEPAGAGPQEQLRTLARFTEIVRDINGRNHHA
jgi:F420-dependent oxidoreductase-like protein